MDGENQEVATPPQNVSELLDRLDRLADTLPKRLRQCALFLRKNINLVAVSTVADLAAAAEVQPSAFMRFCQSLGFSGYSDMQALFRAEYAQLRPGYADRLGVLRHSGGYGSGRLLADFAEAGHKSLISLSNNTDIARVERVVEAMAAARMIHLMGLRRAFPVVSYMSYMLDKMEVACMLHPAAGHVDSIHAVGPGDVVLCVTYSPYSPETVSFAERAREKGMTVIGLTDSAGCPLADCADELLIAREVDVEAFRVPTASLTLLTAIVIAIGGRRVNPG
jgi:DNA-binding MurR/RpiR family transcriptional regulator